MEAILLFDIYCQTPVLDFAALKLPIPLLLWEYIWSLASIHGLHTELEQLAE